MAKVFQIICYQVHSVILKAYQIFIFGMVATKCYMLVLKIS